jgi:hypothetical protein
MLEVLVLGALLGVAEGPLSGSGGAPDAGADPTPAVAYHDPRAEGADADPGSREADHAALEPLPAGHERQPAVAQSSELGRFIYNVALGVTIAVLSTLILRAIL